MNLLLVPQHIRIEISLEERLLKLLERLVDQNDIQRSVIKQTARLDAANKGLAATLAAYPDPDTTD